MFQRNTMKSTKKEGGIQVFEYRLVESVDFQ